MISYLQTLTKMSLLVSLKTSKIYAHRIFSNLIYQVFDFQKHLNGEGSLDPHTLIRADGFRYMSGWYLGRNTTEECVSKLTGCGLEDVGCHDRHALQRLMRGPFKLQFTDSEEQRIIGVPKNLKHAIMTLPHAYAPRLDAAIHLRCQFKHFEQLVGPDDEAWPMAVKELYTWLNSTEGNAGKQLFKIIEERIIEELPNIRGKAAAAKELRRSLLVSARNQLAQMLAINNDSATSSVEVSRTYIQPRSHSSLDDIFHNLNVAISEYSVEERSARRRKTSLQKRRLSSNETENELQQFEGVDGDKIYVYLASDNEIVKEAFAEFLIGHANIAVMRVKNLGGIVHAKNIGYLKGANNNTGLMDLTLDWYSLSLANVVFAWRRDTDILSTFAHSAQRVSGNTGM